MFPRRGLLAALGLLVVVCLGCGKDGGPARYSVEGTVTFDGKPLADGEVIFVPSPSGPQPDAGQIKEGHFRFECLPGTKRVEIRAERNHPTQTMAGADPGTRIPVRQQYIPRRYNENSELRAEVKPEGGNSFSFALEPQ